MPIPIATDRVIDQATDRLEFTRYVGPLIDVLADPNTQTPFTVGIFGTWGSGKTSLLQLLDAGLKEQCPDTHARVQFNAWVHRKEPSMLVPLLHTIRDTLQESGVKAFLDSAKKITEILARLGSDLFLKAITFGQVSVANLEKLEKKYLERQLAVESELRNLRKKLAEVAAGLGENGRLVLFIDDLDRCQPTDIIDLLESVKLFLDVPNVLVILAMDKEVIDRGIEVRYKDFQFSPERKKLLGAEYLEKMIQLPVYLFPVADPQLKRLVEDHPLRPSLTEPQAALLLRVLTPNPRKVKRVMNVLALTRALAAGAQLEFDLVIRLAVLQTHAPLLYADAVPLPDLLPALEMDHEAHRNQKSRGEYKELKLGSDLARVKQLCETHFLDHGPLVHLFEGQQFRNYRKELRRYLSLLGV
jgi:KAP family P-loop domain